MPMIGFRVAISETGAGLKSRLARVPQAIAFGLNNGGRVVFTVVRRGLWEKTGATRYSTITSRTYSMPAQPGALIFTIVARGKPIPIREFPVRRVASGVQASPWGTARVFERSFQEKAVGGDFLPGQFRARLGAAREPIRKLLGPNLAKELLGITRDDQTIPDLFMRTAAIEVPPRVMAALTKALGI
jgi:hypothetical protein